MANVEFKTNQQRRVPIKRNGLFYGREEFNFDMEMGKEYVEGDLGQTIVLYRVDLSKTNQDELYGETRADSIVYMPPVELPCMYEIEEPELKAYDKTKNLGTYQKMGKLKFSVYISTLIDNDVDIKIGDYVGVQVNEREMTYFMVENDGRNNYNNANMLFGTVAVVRNCVASPVEKSVFNG
jgi:hypothetical protein